MKRSHLLVLLLAGYAAVFLRVPALGRWREVFDPLDARPRQVETAVETGHFADALPVALELRTVHAREPLLAYWLAEIYRGLDRSREEAAAWETYVRLSSTPDEACPSMPEAYARLGDASVALQRFEQCVKWDSGNPERLIDLAAALEGYDRTAEALAVYRRAADLDPEDPRILRHIEVLSRRAAGS